MTELRRHLMLSEEALKLLKWLKWETNSQTYSDTILTVGEAYVDQLQEMRNRYLTGGMIIEDIKPNQPHCED